MTQTVPLVAQLGAANTGLLIGYTVYDIDHVLYSAWSSTGVAESDVLGTYYVSGGVVMPDTGGHIVVGEDGSPLCEVAVATDAIAEIASAVLSALGSAGNLDTQLGALQADVDAIRAVTDAIDTSAVTVTTSNDAGALTCYRAVTFNATVSGLTISASWTKVYLTVKTDLDLADSASTIQVVETNPGAGTDGLLYINGAAPSGGITYADAALVVTQAAGTVAIALSDNMTAQLERGYGLHWDLKQIVSGVTSGVLASGTFDVALTPTRTI